RTHAYGSRKIMLTPVPILLYHSIADTVSPGFQTWSVSPAKFADHMKYLRDHDYTPVTVTSLIEAMQTPEPTLPTRPVVITFDDGLEDFYTDALPILTQAGFVSTLYITTGYIGKTSEWLTPEGEGNRPMMTWEQI